MRILVISDREERSLWEYFDRERMRGVELIISCGDLDPDYLEFLVTMQNCPLLYVRGNHDGIYDRKPPRGCIPIDDRIYDYRGIRILGLGGSMRYRPGDDMYTEKQMKYRIRKMKPAISVCGGFDILVTHAPARGWGDLDDLPHRGFSCFNPLLETYKPVYMFHGHVHQEYGRFQRERIHTCGTRIINGCGRCFLDVDPETEFAFGRSGSILYDLYMSSQRRRDSVDREEE